MSADFENLIIPSVEEWAKYLLALANYTDDRPIQYYRFRKAAVNQYKYHDLRANKATEQG